MPDKPPLTKYEREMLGLLRDSPVFPGQVADLGQILRHESGRRLTLLLAAARRLCSFGLLSDQGGGRVRVLVESYQPLRKES